MNGASESNSKPATLVVTMTGERLDRSRYMHVLWEQAIKDRRDCVLVFDEKIMIYPKDEKTA